MSEGKATTASGFPLEGYVFLYLIAYPQAARWDGKGPQAAASSYRCVVDPALVKYMGRTTLVGS